MTMLRLFLVALLASTSHAFSAGLHKHTTRNSALHYSVHDEDKPIECFLIYTEDDDGQLQVDAPLRVICTSQPDEYAWFNGIQRDNLVPTDGVHDHALQCVEGESPRGVPEWECESSFQ